MEPHFLPNPARAVVDPAKVCNYLLSRSHPVGRFKAVVFEVAGYSQGAWVLLQQHLLQTAWLGVTRSRATAFGTHYLVDAILRGPAGRNLALGVVWLVRDGEAFPRMVTAFPRRRA